MNNFWQNLNERERWMVVIASLVVFLSVLYALIYSPIREQLETNTQMLHEKRETLAWMKMIAPENIKGKARQAINNTQLLTLLANELKTSKTLNFPYQLQQTGSGDVQLTFDEVPFEHFIYWLGKLKETYAITIKQFIAERGNRSGITKILVIISSV